MKGLRHHDQVGVSLLELVLVVVVLGIASTGLLVLINQTTKRSADPQMIQQANAIARSYLEEIMLRPFCDPDGFAEQEDCPAMCTTNACGNNCGGGAPGALQEATRTGFDDVCDYNVVNDSTGARDQNGTAIVGLDAYNVSVSVDDTVTLGAAPALTGAAGQVVLVNVNVTHDNNQRVNVSLSGYRVNF